MIQSKLTKIATILSLASLMISSSDHDDSICVDLADCLLSCQRIEGENCANAKNQVTKAQ